MTQYQAPDKQSNRKRNKTGYNMFFTAHVLQMRQTNDGVPSERGFVARDVGIAWKALAAEEKAYYEREADKHNGIHPVKEGEDEVEDDDEDDDDDDLKRQSMDQYQTLDTHPDMHMHSALQASLHPALSHPGHEARHHAYYHPVYTVPPYGHYDYSQHQRHQQARAQGYQQSYPPPGRHAYEGI
jgi:HMG-box domain